MAELGRYNRLQAIKKVDFGFYLDYNGLEILLPKRYAPEGFEPEDWLDVFVYTDSEDRLVATTEEPYAQEGDFACLQVKQVTAFGAFMDIGLLKDLFVPKKEQHKLMLEGEWHVVRICVDVRSQRMIGVSKIGAFLEKETINLSENEEVSLLVYEITTIGYMCIVDNRYVGMLYKNETLKPYNIGDKLSGYVKKLREDNKIDLSIRQQGFAGIKDETEIILSKLQENNGVLPFSDSSSPAQIEAKFGISKKTFKKLIGILYKQGKISILDQEIRLIAQK